MNIFTRVALHKSLQTRAVCHAGYLCRKGATADLAARCSRGTPPRAAVARALCWQRLLGGLFRLPTCAVHCQLHAARHPGVRVSVKLQACTLAAAANKEQTTQEVGALLCSMLGNRLKSWLARRSSKWKWCHTCCAAAAAAASAAAAARPAFRCSLYSLAQKTQ